MQGLVYKYNLYLLYIGIVGDQECKTSRGSTLTPHSDVHIQTNIHANLLHQYGLPPINRRLVFSLCPFFEAQQINALCTSKCI